MAQSNPIASKLVLIIGAIAVVVIFIVLKNKGGDTSHASVVDVETVQMSESTVLLAEEEGVTVEEIMLGVDGDTTNDTIRTLTAQVSLMEKKGLERAQQEIEREKKVNELIDKKENVADNPKVKKLEASVAFFKDKILAMEANMTSLATSVKGKLTGTVTETNEGEFPVSARNGFQKPNTTKVVIQNNSNDIPSLKQTPKLNLNKNVVVVDEITWIEPMDAVESYDEEGNKTSMIPRLNDLFKRDSAAPTQEQIKKGAKPEKERFSTIPRGGTGIDTISLTALIGRIPVGGAIIDPYKFKVLLNAENLASNGIIVEGLASAIVGGRASGDYALSCVNGTIDYITFTFQDGTISSYPYLEEGETATAGPGESLGYISDNAGVPCIQGLFISNGASYLAQQIGLSGLQVGAESYSDAQVDTQFQGESVTTGVTGDKNKYVAGQMASESLDTTINWLEERQQSSFDAVYLPPATKMTLHFEREIPIDYDPIGRRTNYGSQQQIFDNSNNLSGLY
jgi:integrating conjugative element protein (TIGR03752 family)